jgi:hypothetical protein
MAIIDIIEYYYATGYWQGQSNDKEVCSCYGTKVSHGHLYFVMPGASPFSIKLLIIISTSRPWKSFIYATDFWAMDYFQ